MSRITPLTLAPVLQPGTAVLDADALITQGLRLYNAGGLPRGDSTGWPSVDELVTVAPGQTTIVTGTPNSGKTEWLDALIVNLAETDAWDFAIYSPENWPPATHLVKLVEKRTRKPFGPGPNERMNIIEYAEAAAWVTTRIFWLEPDLKTPDELIKTALAMRKPGVRFGVVLDPWNSLEHQRGGMSESDYVSFILTEVTKLARAANAHVWLVVHPAKIPRNKDGTRPIPTPYDLSGSAHFYNKADNIITIHRDQVEQSQDVDIHVQKVRHKWVGHTGLTTLKYDKVTGRYFEFGSHLRDVRGRPEVYRDPESVPKPPALSANGKNSHKHAGTYK